METIVDINSFWVQEVGAGRICKCCERVVFKNIYVLWMKINMMEEETEMIVCKKCLNEIEE